MGRGKRRQPREKAFAQRRAKGGNTMRLEKAPKAWEMACGETWRQKESGLLRSQEIARNSWSLKRE